MSNESQIKLLYKKKLKEIKKHNKLYFLKDSPKISDFEYDKIKQDVLKLEKKYPFLKINP